MDIISTRLGDKELVSLEINRLIKDVSNVIVLDRNYSPGLGGVLHQEVKAALYGVNKGPRIHGLLAGVGGVNVTPEKIQELALHYADSEPAVASIWVD